MAGGTVVNACAADINSSPKAMIFNQEGLDACPPPPLHVFNTERNRLLNFGQDYDKWK